MARQERSAGVVVFHQKAGPRTYLLLDYGRHWDFPKGHVEKEESDAAAALRELREETGISGVELIDGFSHEITYFFRDHKTHALVRKTVVFFLAQAPLKKAILSEEHIDYAFLPFEKALNRLTFANARQVLRLAEKFLK